MATRRFEIEHLERVWEKNNEEKPWKKLSHSRKWLKKQMNKYIRRKMKDIGDDEVGEKRGKKPLRGYEY